MLVKSLNGSLWLDFMGVVPRSISQEGRQRAEEGRSGLDKEVEWMDTATASMRRWLFILRLSCFIFFSLLHSPLSAFKTPLSFLEQVCCAH